METFPYQDLPINYNQVYTGQPDGQTEGGATTGGGGLLPGQVTPRRSLSQSLLSQMSSPTMGFGLTARSPSPSSLISNALRRTPSFNRPGFMSRGPSLQSLVKSFINRVSRGTQTDSDDNDFDQVSIASVNSGFSAVAGDLTRSRLKLFLNDNQPRHIKSYASSQVDNESFLEELQNLRDEIHGEFGSEPEPVYTDNQFEIDELAEESESVSVYVTEKESSRESQAAVHKVLTCDREAETDAIDAKDCTTQTEVPKKVQRAEKAIETDPVVALPVPQVKEMVTQTIEILSPVAVVTVPPKPKMSDGETQTDLLKFCEHCSRIQLANSHDSAPPSKIIHEIVVQQPQPQILKNCEFIISHADIICKENKIIRPDGESTIESIQAKPESKSASAQVNTIEPTCGTEEADVPVKSEINGKIDDTDKTIIEASSQAENQQEVVEEIVQINVNNLEAQMNLPSNGHQTNGMSTNVNSGKQNGYSTVETVVVFNGTLPKNDKKKKKEKKTPKKSPRKILAIIPGTDDEQKEKHHQAALTHVRPKCCTIS